MTLNGLFCVDVPLRTYSLSLSLSLSLSVIPDISTNTGKKSLTQGNKHYYKSMQTFITKQASDMLLISFYKCLTE